MKDLRNKGFSTRVVHSGEGKPRGQWSPVSTPIYSTVGYRYESMDELDAVFGGKKAGYVYTRFENPTVAAFEEAMAVLEGGEAAQAYGSGMAAVHAALLAAGLKTGSSIVTTLDLYGATTTLLKKLFGEMGVSIRLVDVINLGAVEAALAETRPAVLLCETISNPLMKVADVPSLAELAHRYNARFLVDNTFASPYLFNPISHGADYVIHSITKYIGGHGDVTGGVVVTSSENRQKLNDLNKLVGGILGPFEAWLALRGCKTLSLRMGRQSENANQVAKWLTSHPRIARVNYPGLPGDPRHNTASRLFGNRGFGGMLSFEIRNGDRATAFQFMDALQLCLAVTTLGDIYSLVLHPATSSHRGLSQEERSEVGISDGLVRLSVGIEDAGDIISDLDHALAELKT
jgi:cystathionine beta-lyase/cystathionine gamma-synthase